MCSYQTLFHDDGLGYVVRCMDCEKIQLGYGNLILTFGYVDFSSFIRWLRTLIEEQDPEQVDSLRNIIIPTPYEGIKLILSKRELKEFSEMLEMADTELKSLEMMRLFGSVN